MSDPRTLKLPPVTVYLRKPMHEWPTILHKCNSEQKAQDWINAYVHDDDLADVYIDEGG